MTMIIEHLELEGTHKITESNSWFQDHQKSKPYVVETLLEIWQLSAMTTALGSLFQPSSDVEPFANTCHNPTPETQLHDIPSGPVPII